MKIKKRLYALLAIAIVFCTLLGAVTEWLPMQGAVSSAQAETMLLARSKKKKASPTPVATATPAPAAEENLPTATPVPEGPVTDPQSIADYIFANGCLPENFITKREAQNRGWDSSWNYVSDVAPGFSIGGDRFGNYEGLLPKAPGRQYYEADCWYTKGKRNAYRIIFSNDGLVYYTADHYQTFIEMHPTTENLANGITGTMNKDGTWSDSDSDSGFGWW